MIPSFFGPTGISVVVSDQIFVANPTYSRTFVDEVSAYSHVISAKGGFLSASFTVFLKDHEIMDFIENGIGRDIVAFGHNGAVAFNGFINQANINYGTLTANRGPLFDVANRVSVMYAPIIDDTVDPPIVGDRTETTIAEDVDSQAKYGIIEKILSAGNLLDDGTTNEANEARDLYLAEMKELYTDENVNIAGGNIPSVTFDCLGYNEWFKVYAYNDLNPLSVTFITKLQSVINADPNNVFSTDFDEMESNLLLTTAYEDENRLAESVIQSLVVQGGASNERWTWGVYEDRKIHYKAVPTTFDYVHRVASEHPVVERFEGGILYPWEIRPARWAVLPGFLHSVEVTGTTRINPRAMFIESVNFTAPSGLTLNGARVNTVEQRLAQLGVRGI